MKTKLKNIIIIFLTLIILYIIIKEKILIKNTIFNALNIWYTNIIPSLFPFFIISDILINYNITNYIPHNLKKILKKIFNITDNMLEILLLSILSGFTFEAKNAKTLYENNEITLDEANHIIIFSHFANPIFILGIISILLNNKKISIIILITQYISNLILGLLIRNNFKHTDKIKLKNNNKNFTNILLSSINKSVDTLLSICGILTIFLILSTILVDVVDISPYSETIIKCLLEITIGIDSLSKLNLNNIYITVLTSAFISFGGLSIHMQVKNYLLNTPIDYKYYLLGRILETTLSIIVSFTLCILFKI